MKTLDEKRLCACMGPMYGEPHCYCKMISMGLPLNERAREVSRETFKIQMDKYFESIKEK